MFTFIFGVAFIACVFFGLRFLWMLVRGRGFRLNLLLWAFGLFVVAGFAATQVPTSSDPGNHYAAAKPHGQNHGFFHRLARKFRVAVAPTHAPTPEPTEDPYAEEHEMLENVSSVTPTLVEGNAAKYVGKVVKWRCTVTNVVQGSTGGETVANAECDDTLIVLGGDAVKDFDADQEVVVLGKVATFDGTNGFGGEREFPAVEVSYVMH